MSRFHRWYDTLQEPWRMLLMLGIVILFVLVPMGYEPHSLMRAGIFVAAFLGITRVWYVTHGRTR